MTSSTIRTRLRGGAVALAALVLIAGASAALLLYRNTQERGVAYGDRAAVPMTYSSAPSIGANTFLNLEPDPEKIRRELAILKSAGIGIIRQQFIWEEIEPRQGVFWSEFRQESSWSKYDVIVESARAEGLEIMARLERPPRWATQDWEPENPASQKPPDDLERFGDFVEAVVSRYKGDIRYFQIWNEPNLWGEWGESDPDAAEYVEMLRIAHDRAKGANPEAVIVVAGLAPTTERGPRNISDILYLQRMYFLGAKDYFDIASTMSYGLLTGPNDIRIGERWTNFPRAILWRDVMEAFGDSNKPIWASEYGWMALPEGWSGRPSIWGNHPVETQSSWTVDGIARARDQWPWMPTIFIWASRWPVQSDPDDPTYWFRLMDPDFTPRPALLALREFAAGAEIVGVGFHQEDHPAFSFRGPWPREPSDEAVDGLWSATGVAGAIAEFRFEGDAVDLVTRRGPDMGVLRVRIDELDALADEVPKNRYGQATIDLYSPIPEPASIFHLASRLPRGDHLLEIESLGRPSSLSTGGKVVVDAVVVTNARPLWPYAATAGTWMIGIAILAWRFLTPVWDGMPAGIRRITPVPPVFRHQSVHGISVAALAAAVVAAALLGLLPGGPLASPQTIVRAVILLYVVILAIARPESVAVVAVGAQFLQPVRPQVGPFSFPLPELLFAALALGWAIRGIYRRGFEVRSSAVGWIALYFVAAALAATAFSDYPKFALRSLRTNVVEPVALFFLLTAYIDRRRSVVLVAALAAGGAIAGLTAVFDPLLDRVIIAGVPRLRGIFDSPNNLAFTLERTLPLLLGIFLAAGNPRLRRVAGTTAIAIGVLLISTFSRGAWLASVSGLILMGTPLWRRLSGIRQALVAGGVLIPVAVFLGFIGAERISVLFRAGDRSGVSRVWLWDSSIQMIRDFPLFGLGPDNFLYHYPAYLRPEAWREPNMSHPHNLFLDGWLSVGVFGVLALLAALGAFFYLIRRMYAAGYRTPSRTVILGSAAAMTAAALHGLVDNSYFLPELAGFFWSMLAFAVAGSGGGRKQPHLESTSSTDPNAEAITDPQISG